MRCRKDLSESEMEDAIAANPEKYLGEQGLKLIARQYRIGPYIFDLLFEDRHGTKLIVELQRGTLDRNHTYKILDYYDEYKTRKPKEFIDLMIVANKILHERRQRLNSQGVNWREIPEYEFIDSVISTKEDQEYHNLIGKPESKSIILSEKPPKKENTIPSSETFTIFQKQTDMFIFALKDIQPPIKITVRPDYPKNPFTCFAPVSWGYKRGKSSSGPGSGYGRGALGYAFHHTKNNNGENYVRLHIGVESPFKEEFKKMFKDEVYMAVKARNVILPEGCNIWPNSKCDNFKFHGTALLECNPVILNNETWRVVYNNYIILNNQFNGLVTNILQNYRERDAFNVDIKFNI